jgi:murein DD-endopeptidase MepM/ murein hydrolase activator NlpD
VQLTQQRDDRMASRQHEGGRLRFLAVRRWSPWLLSSAAGVLVLLALRIHGVAPMRDAPSLPGQLAESDLHTYTESDTVHRGDTLAGLLLRNRMGLQQIERVLREIRTRGYFSPRALMPGQVLEFTRDEGGGLVRLACRVAPGEIYVFDVAGDSLRSFAQAVDSEVRVRKLTGMVQSTFEEAVLAAGGDPRLAGKLADILDCEIDFFTEVRRGDRFSLLVEEKYVEGSFVGYGEVLYGKYKGEEASGSAVYFRPTGGKGGHYDLEGKSLRRAFLKSPLNYRRISSFFANSRFHPILRTYRPHRGVDYAAAEGTPIVAVADGVVEYAGWKGGYGRFIEIRHDRNHATCYGHLNHFAANVRSGARIKQGEKIGYVGHTGLATGPHLHYEVVENGRSVNPLSMKNLPSEPIAEAQLSDFRRLVAEMASADQGMAAGDLLAPEAWAGLLAQNSATGPTASSD